MSRKRRSLPKAGPEGSRLDDGQGLLLEVPAHPVEAEAVRLKVCTAQLMLKRHPESYREIVDALAKDMPIRTIKRLWGVGTDTVYAILRLESKEVGTLKRRIATELMVGGLAGAQRASALVLDCDDPVAAAMATKMMLETGNLMMGQATQITEQRVVVVDATSAAARLMQKAAELKAAGKMGCGGGENGGLREVGPMGARAEGEAGGLAGGGLGGMAGGGLGGMAGGLVGGSGVLELVGDVGRVSLDAESDGGRAQCAEDEVLSGACHRGSHQKGGKEGVIGRRNAADAGCDFEGGGGGSRGARGPDSQ